MAPPSSSPRGRAGRSRAPAAAVLAALPRGVEGSESDGGAAGDSDSDFVVHGGGRPSAAGRHVATPRARDHAAPAGAAGAASGTQKTCPFCNWRVQRSGLRRVRVMRLTSGRNRATHSLLPASEEAANAHANKCLDGQSGGQSGPAGAAPSAHRKPAAPQQHPTKVVLNLLTLSKLQQHLRAWRLDQPNAKRHVLEERWRTFMVLAQVAQDKARAGGGGVDYVTVAHQTLKHEQNRGTAATAASAAKQALVSCWGGSGGGKAAAAGSGAGDARAKDVYAQLIAQVKGRGGGAAPRSALPPPSPPPDDVIDLDAACGMQLPPDAPDDLAGGKRKRAGSTPAR